MAREEDTYGTIESQAGRADEAVDSGDFDEVVDGSNCTPMRLNRSTYFKAGGLAFVIVLIASLSVLLTGNSSTSSSGSVSSDVVEGVDTTAGVVDLPPLSSTGGRLWSVYKYTTAGHEGVTWADIVKYYLTYDMEDVDLGCNAQKFTGFLGEIELHFVESDALEEPVEEMSTSYWQNVNENIFQNMETFHPFMNNKIQILVPSSTLARMDKHMRSDEGQEMFPTLSVMRRLSKTDGEKVAHLVLNIQGNVYEVVSTVDDELNMSEFTYWADTECGPAQKMLYKPSEMIKVLSDNGAFTKKSGGGYEVGEWTAMMVNTAAVIDDIESFGDKENFGMTVEQATHEYCTVTTVSYFSGDEFAAQLQPYRKVSYVRMDEEEEALKLTTEWETDISSAHVQLQEYPTEHPWSNWNHWLDRHVGIHYYPGGDVPSDEVAQVAFSWIKQYMEDNPRPIGFRMSFNESKYYTGYSNTLTWEYNVNKYWETWEQDICTCLHSNNNLDYSNVFGEECPTTLNE